MTRVIRNPVVDCAYAKETRVVALCEHRRAGAPLQEGQRSRGTLSYRQIVWLLSEGRTTGEVCRVTGYSPGWVRQIARRYNERGVEGLGDRRHANPGARERALLDEEGQAQLREAGGCGAGRRWRAG